MTFNVRISTQRSWGRSARGRRDPADICGRYPYILWLAYLQVGRFPGYSRSPDPAKVQHRGSYGLVVLQIGSLFRGLRFGGRLSYNSVT